MPFQLSEETVDALLDKLSSDQEFRDTFQKDPRQALASLGHAAAKDEAVAKGAWTCLTVSALASMDTIKKSRAELRNQLLNSKVSHMPITLEMAKK